MYESDTIAAISTAKGTGGIGIIRISGARAFEITGRIFKGKRPFSGIKTHTINYGWLVDPESGKVIDEVLVSKMSKPNTFTKEDVVEINCHGGFIVLKKALELVISGGARPAEAGEFTKRAFLNGRIDLSQAEAVIDLIYSKTEEGSRAAADQLEGKLSKKLKEVRSRLVELIAHIEVTVDYPEHDIEEITGRQVYDAIHGIHSGLKDILRNFEKGRILREGIKVVIVGRPNVGKSSLMNELSGKNRAIVTDIPGTTRDIIEEYVNINGIPVRLVDTAGIRETEDVVERIGVERANEAIETSDLVILMLDGSSGVLEEDLALYKKINGLEKKRFIVLLNKIDVSDEGVLHDVENAFHGRKIIKTSLKENIGIEALEEEITGLFISGSLNSGSEILVTNVRHKNMIDMALKSIEEAAHAFESGMPLDCMTIDIKNAAEYLGQITGESVGEDVMKEIFSRFCIGK